MSSRLRWCPQCGARFPREAFDAHPEDVYVGDGQRMGRAYEHKSCGAVVIALLPVVVDSGRIQASPSSGREAADGCHR